MNLWQTLEITDMGRANCSAEIKPGNLETESKWVNKMEEPRAVHTWGAKPEESDGRERKHREH